MTNEYFSSFSRLPRNQLARAEAVNAVFDAIVVGFDGVPSAASIAAAIVAAAASAAQALASASIVSATVSQWAAGAGLVNATTGAFPTTVTALTDGMVLGFRANLTNTSTTPTFKADGTTARTITRTGGLALQVGDIQINGEYWLRYNLANTRWELLNPTQAVGSGANKIINGGMDIDQRNAGASVPFTNLNPYTVDRFQAASSGLTTQTVAAQQVTSTLAGCLNSLKVTVGGTGAAPAAGAYAQVLHPIEGTNTADLLWGTANAKPITISFRCKYSVSGTYAVAVRNSATNRSYIASFAVISGVDTPVILTIPGDTSGTWLTSSGIGLSLDFDLGTGTTLSSTAGAWQAGNFLGLTGGTKLIATTGATFEVSQVKVEVGSVATPYVADDYAVLMQKCLRYCWVFNSEGNSGLNFGPWYNNTAVQGQAFTKAHVPMRIVPSLTQVGTSMKAVIFPGGTFTVALGVSVDVTTGRQDLEITTGGIGSVAATYGLLVVGDSTTRLIFNAEL